MKREMIGNIFFIVLSIIVCVYSIKINIGSVSNPGSGFLPFVSAIFFGTLSVILIIKLSIFKKSQQRETCSEFVEQKRFTKSRKRIIFVILSLSVYIIMMPKLGYLISTFLLMVFLFGFTRQMKWYLVLIYSFSVVLISYLVFEIWLSCQFPRGVLHYWR